MLSGYQRFFLPFSLSCFCVFTTDYLRYQMKWWLFCLLSLTVIVIPPSHSCTFFMSLMCSLASIHFIFLGAFSDITFLSFSGGHCARIRKILLFLLHFCFHFIFINCPTLPFLPVICFLFHWIWALSSHGVRMLNEQMEGLMGWIDWLFHFPFARVSSECVDVVIYFIVVDALH